jgi:hypothetical protein
MISYNLKLIKQQINNNSTTGCCDSGYLAFVSTVSYKPGDEYKYTYTSNVDPMSLISGYGISLLGNPYADITIDVPNLLMGRPNLYQKCLLQNNCFDEELMRKEGFKDVMGSSVLSYRISQTTNSSLR